MEYYLLVRHIALMVLSGITFTPSYSVGDSPSKGVNVMKCLLHHISVGKRLFLLVSLSLFIYYYSIWMQYVIYYSQLCCGNQLVSLLLIYSLITNSIKINVVRTSNSGLIYLLMFGMELLTVIGLKMSYFITIVFIHMFMLILQSGRVLALTSLSQ